jgi:hypothetical protein
MMSRRLLVTAAFVAFTAASAGLGLGLYAKYFDSTSVPDVQPYIDDPTKPLVQTDEFEELARTNPVAMLGQCLSRYQREVKGGVRFTLRKQERVQGKPLPPDVPPVEVIEVWVRGDVPDPETKRTAIEVLMRWKSGARKPSSDFTGLARPIEATLFSDKPAPEGYGGKVVTRPGVVQPISAPMDPSSQLAKGQSRFCIRDAGLYRSMLRTHAAWEARQAEGTLDVRYLGKQTPEHVGRECYVIRRVCREAEVDAFEVGGKPDPTAAASEGFNEVTIYIDAERWLQVGTELYRTGADGTRVLVGSYFFRDVELNPEFPADTFTAAGLKK